MVTLFYVFAEDASVNTSEVEMVMVPPQYMWLLGVLKDEEYQHFWWKYIFYGPCAPCETTKHGYWFKIDDKAFQKYKTIQSNQRY